MYPWLAKSYSFLVGVFLYWVPERKGASHCLICSINLGKGLFFCGFILLVQYIPVVWLEESFYVLQSLFNKWGTILIQVTYLKENGPLLFSDRLLVFLFLYSEEMKVVLVSTLKKKWVSFSRILIKGPSQWLLNLRLCWWIDIISH